LREALGAAGAMIETVRGAGYRLTAKPVSATVALEKPEA
jgi:two-component system phosphate regulon response regulator PhoB